MIEEIYKVRIGGELFNFTDLTQGKVLKSVAKQREVKSTPHQKRLQEALGFEEDKWHSKYKYIKKHSISTKKGDLPNRTIHFRAIHKLQICTHRC